MVHFPFPEFEPELGAGRLMRVRRRRCRSVIPGLLGEPYRRPWHRRRQQEIQDPPLPKLLRLPLDPLQMLRLGHSDRKLGEVADDRLDISTNVADFGELRGLHFQERGLCELGQAARNFRLPDARGTDHDDVLGHHLITQVRAQLLPAPAIPEGDGNHPLRLPLTDHIAVQLLHNLAGSQVVGARSGRCFLLAHNG